MGRVTDGSGYDFGSDVKGITPLDQAMRAVGRERLAELLKKYSVPGQFPGTGFIQSFEAGKDAGISDDVTYEDVIDKKNPKMQL